MFKDKKMKSKPPNKGSLQWTLLKDINSLIIFFCSFFMGMGVHVVAPVIPEIMSFFKVNEARVGLIMSLFTFPTIILSPLIGSFADRFGRKIFLTGGIFLYGVSGTLPVFLNFNFNFLLVTRVIQGIGFAAAMPLTVTVLGDLYDGSKEVAAQGIRTFFLATGGFLFPLLGGTLAILGWNYPFIFFSLAILFAFFIWRYLPESTEQGNKKNSINLKYFLEELRVIKDFYILMVLISSLIRFFLSIGIMVYLPILLVNRFTENLALVGLILGIRQFFKSVASLQVGSIVSRWGLITPFIFGFFVYGLGSFLIPVSPSIIPIFFLMAILGIGDGILAPLQKSLITQNIQAKNRAAIVSINASLQGIGRTISPIILGIIMINYGLYWTFWSMTLIAALPILYFCFKKRSNIK